MIRWNSKTFNLQSVREMIANKNGNNKRRKNTQSGYLNSDQIGNGVLFFCSFRLFCCFPSSLFRLFYHILHIHTHSRIFSLHCHFVRRFIGGCCWFKFNMTVAVFLFLHLSKAVKQFCIVQMAVDTESVHVCLCN